MQHLCANSEELSSLLRAYPRMSSLAKVLPVASNQTTCSTACPGLRQFLSVSTLRSYSPGGVLPALAPAPRGSLPQAPSTHRLRRGLPGYLILFAPHAVAHQCQKLPSRPPSPPVFLRISTHSTATPGIPSASTALEFDSRHGRPGVEPRAFTTPLSNHLRALYAQ